MSLRIHLEDDHIARRGHRLQGPLWIFLQGTHRHHTMKYGLQGLPANIRLSSLHGQLQRMCISEMAQQQEARLKGAHLSTTSRLDLERCGPMWTHE
jgi:hypothetical protein